MSSLQSSTIGRQRGLRANGHMRRHNSHEWQNDRKYSSSEEENDRIGRNSNNVPTADSTILAQLIAQSQQFSSK